MIHEEDLPEVDAPPAIPQKLAFTPFLHFPGGDPSPPRVRSALPSSRNSHCLLAADCVAVCSAAIVCSAHCGSLLRLFWSLLCSPVRPAPPQHVYFCVLCAHAHEHIHMSRHVQMHTCTCTVCPPCALPALRVAQLSLHASRGCTFSPCQLRISCTAHSLHISSCVPRALRTSRTMHLMRRICCIACLARLARGTSRAAHSAPLHIPHRTPGVV